MPTSFDHLDSLLAHAGAEIDAATGAVLAPLHLATTYQRDASGEYPRGYYYTRYDNPTRALLERTLAQLHGGEAAASFASGQAATSAVLMALQPGDHVVAPLRVYTGTRTLLKDVMAPWGLQYDRVDMTDLDAVHAVLRPETRLVWVETPNNPTLELTDIARLSELLHPRGILLLVDATLAPPPLQSPLDMGADFVMHSTTKYLSGHSDVLGGVVVAKHATGLFERIRQMQQLMGGVPSPFDCYQTLRGLRSLGARLKVHCANAQRVAEALAADPRVTAVHYPGLDRHPQRALALAQLHGGFGGMVSFEVEGGAEAALAVAAHTRVFTRATSLGGTESLIEHRASMEGPDTVTAPGLLRMSIGLEHPDELIADLKQALTAAIRPL